MTAAIFLLSLLGAMALGIQPAGVTPPQPEPGAPSPHEPPPDQDLTRSRGDRGEPEVNPLAAAPPRDERQGVRGSGLRHGMP